jgi:anti-sigma factor RsiW
MNRTTHEIEPEEVMAYLDGELEASRASEVAAHITACKECAMVESDLRTVSNQLAGWSVAPPSPAITQAIERATLTARPNDADGTNSIRKFSSHTFWLARRPWKFAAALAAVVVVVVGATTFLRSTYNGHSTAGANSETNFFSAPRAKSQTSELSATAESLNGAPMIPEATPAPMQAATAQMPAAGPMIARTASMNLVVAKLDAARASLEKLLARHRGFTSEMTLDQSNDASASLNGTLQVPATELDAMLGELRGLGRVTTESQGGEDVSDQHVDLAARLHNARASETRLLDILRTRTGKVGDVLEVEEQISKTRGEIEEMEAQLAGLDKRVAYASIKLQMGEEYKAPAGANGSVALRLRNAIVGGYRDAVDSLLALAVFLLSAGPTLLIWGFILFWPARAIWRRRGVLRGAFGKG